MFTLKFVGAAFAGWAVILYGIRRATDWHLRRNERALAEQRLIAALAAEMWADMNAPGNSVFEYDANGGDAVTVQIALPKGAGDAE